MGIYRLCVMKKELLKRAIDEPKNMNDLTAVAIGALPLGQKMRE